MHMSTMIQIRHVPDDVHRALKSRAARAGMTLSDYLREEVTRIARRPALEDVLDRIAARKRPAGHVDSERAVRAERDAR